MHIPLLTALLLFLGNLFHNTSIATKVNIQDNTPITIKSVIEQINAERKRNGLSNLEENNKLDNAASSMALDMLKKNYWSSTSPAGKTSWSFINDTGYDYSYAGTELGRNYSNTESLIANWMDNNSDKKNILSKNFKDIGVSVIRGKFMGEENTTLIVQMLGSEKQVNANTSTSENQQTYQSSSNIVDCVGPDGKHLQVTQKQCADFNAAWGNAYNNKIRSNQTNIGSVQCPNGYGSYFITSSWDSCQNYWNQQGEYLKQWTQDQMQQTNQYTQSVQNQTNQYLQNMNTLQQLNQSSTVQNQNTTQPIQQNVNPPIQPCILDPGIWTEQ